LNALNEQKTIGWRCSFCQLLTKARLWILGTRRSPEQYLRNAGGQKREKTTPSHGTETDIFIFEIELFHENVNHQDTPDGRQELRERYDL